MRRGAAGLPLHHSVFMEALQPPHNKYHSGYSSECKSHTLCLSSARVQDALEKTKPVSVFFCLVFFSSLFL